VSAGATIGGAALFALVARMINVVSLTLLIVILSGYLIARRAPAVRICRGND